MSAHQLLRAFIHGETGQHHQAMERKGLEMNTDSAVKQEDTTDGREKSTMSSTQTQESIDQVHNSCSSLSLEAAEELITNQTQERKTVDSPHQTHGGCPMSGHQLDHHEADTMVHRLCLVGLVIVDESKVC